MKAMLHVHTCFSTDGELTPRTIGRLARDRGFGAVLLADHFESLDYVSFGALVEECRWVKDSVMVPGYERSWSGYHVLALGVDRWLDDPDPEVWADQVRRAGGLVVIAHPGRYSHRIPDTLLEMSDAVEVWNSKPPYDGSFGPDPRGYDLLGAGRLPLCGQDLHGVRHLSSVGVELPNVTAGSRAIVEAIRGGHYRMTNGKVRYGRELSPAARRSLGAFHRTRRHLVDFAIGARTGWRRAAAKRRVEVTRRVEATRGVEAAGPLAASEARRP